MKKTLSLILTLMLALGCVFSLASCGNADIAGTYELDSFSGSITAGGEVTELPSDAFEYYTMIFNDDGTGVEKAKSAFFTNGAEEKKNFEWELDGTKLYVSYKEFGVTITEEATIENGVITYEMSQVVAEGVTVYMKGVFKKQ